MKAVPVLLCLALAHGISARIFNFGHRQDDNLDVQQQDYIDRIRQHRNQPSNFDKLNHHHKDQQSTAGHTQPQDILRELERYQHQQGEQQRDQQGYTNRDQQYQPQEQKTEWDQTGETKYKEQTEQYQPSQHMKYQPSSGEQYQNQDKEQNLIYQQSHNSQQRQEAYPQSGTTSDENGHVSQESNDNIKSNTKIDNELWIPQDVAGSQENHGDVTNRNAVQMPIVSKVLGHTKEQFEKIFGDAKKAMKHVTNEAKVHFHRAYELAKQQHNEDAELNATQLAQKYQYPVEEHTVKTDDGYQLTLFRISAQKHIRDVQKRPVVFLMHGIDGSADDWLIMGPQKSLAYLLADAGYDVWLGNARGNRYSNHHVSKHPAVSDFWQFSIDEIALHDLPAMIDYALETAQQEKLYYVGYSQGTTDFFALTAARPEYNDKIIMMYALSPIVYMNNVRSPLIRMISPLSMFYNRLQHQFGNGPFNPSKDLIHTAGGSMLEKLTGCKGLSSNVNFVMSGVNLADLDPELMPVVMRHLQAGTSAKVIKQYGQIVASKEFRKFDYGPKTNEKVYGTEQPPKYEMEKVQAPVTLYYSEEDWLAHPKDVERLVRELPNVKETYKVPDEHFSHMDFQFSKNAPEMVYRRLIESMQNSQEQVQRAL